MPEWLPLVRSPLSQLDRASRSVSTNSFSIWWLASEVKFFRGFVVLVDGSAIGPAKLDSVRGDARQHGLKVESRAYRLTDFAERFELAHRACQFVGSLIQFFEQPHVLDGDHGLVGEGLEKSDLLVGERSDFRAANVDHSDRNTFAQQRRASTVRVPWVCCRALVVRKLGVDLRQRSSAT